MTSIGLLSRLLTTFAAGACVLGAARPEGAQAAPAARALTLPEAVALAKDRAPLVHAAFARIASAEAVVDRARAANLPSAYLQGTATTFASNGQVYSGGVSSTTSNDWYLLGQGSLNLQWMLYDFGRTSSAIDAAHAGVNAAELSARASQQIAMAEAAVAFFTLLADDDLVRSAEAARADRERVMGITHRLVEAGYRTQVDETRAQVGLEVAKLDAAMAEASRDNDAVTLAAALMVDPATSFRLAPPSQIAIDERSAADGTAAVRARGEVGAAAARVEQARRDLVAARRAHLPVLAASGSGTLLYSRDRSFYSGPPPLTVTSQGPSDMAQGSVTLTVPLFDPLINANVKAAEASFGEAQANLEQTTLTARSEASKASRQVRSARTVLEQSQRLATGAAANLAAVEDRYAGGMESPLALADAQREDALARVAVVRAHLAFEVAGVRLLQGLSRVDELTKVR